MIECKKCGLEKEESEFLVWKSGPRIGKLRKPCKQCMAKSHKSWYKNPKNADWKIKNKEYYDSHKEQYRQHRKRRYESHKKEELSRSKLWMKNNAERWKKYNSLQGRIRSHTLRARGILHVSSIKLVEDYNKEYYNSSGYTCEYCESPVIKYHLEHIHPVSRGGSNSVYNLAISCQKCNNKKWAHEVSSIFPEAIPYFEERFLNWNK